jgi:hypothetical protein
MNFVNLRDRRSQMQLENEHIGMAGNSGIIVEGLQQEQIRQAEP